MPTIEKRDNSIGMSQAGPFVRSVRLRSPAPFKVSNRRFQPGFAIAILNKISLDLPTTK